MVKEHIPSLFFLLGSQLGRLIYCQILKIFPLKEQCNIHPVTPFPTIKISPWDIELDLTGKRSTCQVWSSSMWTTVVNKFLISAMAHLAYWNVFQVHLALGLLPFMLKKKKSKKSSPLNYIYIIGLPHQ